MNELLDKLTSDSVREALRAGITQKGIDTSIAQNSVHLFSLEGPTVHLTALHEDQAQQVSEILRRAVQQAPRVPFGPRPPITRGAILDTAAGWALVYVLGRLPGSLRWRIFEDIGPESSTTGLSQ
jgi:hypothetical protein